MRSVGANGDCTELAIRSETAHRREFMRSNSYWGKYAAEKADRLRKGARATVTGRIGLRRWERDGKSGVSLELRASDVSVAGTSDAPRREPTSYGPQGNAGREAPEDPHARFGGDEDLPF